jgi:hypothetical protein
MKHLLLLLTLLTAACDPAKAAASLTTIGGVDVRSDGYGPYAEDSTYFLPDYAEHSCRPYVRVVLPPGYCAVTRGVIAGVSRDSYDVTDCKDPIFIECQMWGEPADSDSITEIYVDSRDSVEFRTLKEGCSCE